MYLLSLLLILIVIALEAPLNPPWRRIVGIAMIVVLILYLLGFTGVLGPSPYLRVR